MKPNLKIPVCPKCKSEAVFQAASASWDPFVCQWQLSLLHKDMLCGECDHEFTEEESWVAADIKQAEFELLQLDPPLH